LCLNCGLGCGGELQRGNSLTGTCFFLHTGSGCEDGGMHPTLLALLEVLLLASGGLAARRFVRRVGRGERKLVLMASVSAWLVLFGLVPFSVFAAFTPGTGQAAGPVETLILNMVPLALVASPALGIAQALVLTGRRGA
jgi:hypothetical protein